MNFKYLAMAVFCWAALMAGATPADSLMQQLKNAEAEGKTYFGHHDATVYGHTWMGDSCRSDVRDVAGRFPGLISWDVSNIDWGRGRNLEERVRSEVAAQHRRGGINTFCWHAIHPLTGATPWQVEDTTLVWQIVHTPEGQKAYAEQLDRICDFFDSLVDDNGNKIPVVFRPWHEHTGSWFWWGRGNCTVDDYVALWTVMRRHFDRRGIDNVVWAYSPDRCKNVDEYMERYPGDEFVDIMGADVYHFDGYEGIEEFERCATQTLEAAIGEARKRGKVAAFTETGLESLTVPDWYTSVLQPLLRKCPVAYVIVWRNAFRSPTHFYAPYPGHPSEVSFREFAADPAMIFVD